MSERILEGLLFDGRTAAATPVRVTVAGRLLRVATAAGEPLREAPLGELVFGDAFASAPRQVTFRDGAVVEISDGAALTEALAGVGERGGLVDRLQQRWLAALGALVATVALVAATYAWGLPAAARAVAAALPEDAERRLGEGVLEILDRFVQPSELPEAERTEVERRIREAARLAAPGLRFRVEFRSIGQEPGVNAFALPGATIVLLDELVRRTSGDDRLLAVVGHELAHVARRHSTQALLRAAGLGAMTSLLWGDFSGQVAAVPAVLAMLDHSRDAEREADEDAVRFLRATGRSARPMLDALCFLAGVEREMGVTGFPSVLSSHPAIEERLARVRAVAGLEGEALECGGRAPPEGVERRGEAGAER